MSREKFISIGILFLGDTGVGKTSLINQANAGKFSEEYQSTLYRGMFSSSGCKIDVELGKFSEAFLLLGDTSKFDSHTLNLYKDGAYALVYDITRKPTLENLKRIWLKKLNKDVKSEISFILLGNKCDLEELRVYSKEEGIKLANKIGACGAFEVSAKTGEGIKDALKVIALDAYQLHGKKLVRIAEEKD
ncbi:MAG: hypothetical protein GF311_01575 [Candidatus Lokiarchaeota archaeon]|nr:hypothetical protein [Candidatus Lokiarchaeota archaeon]